MLYTVLITKSATQTLISQELGSKNSKLCNKWCSIYPAAIFSQYKRGQADFFFLPSF